MPIVEMYLGAFAILSGILLIERGLAEIRFNRELDRRNKREAELMGRILHLNNNANAAAAKSFEIENRVEKLERTLRNVRRVKS